ncbi:MAG: phosphatidylglycerophosphatase A [Parabacteroides sp.]|nr:phosphatidylglycerophosphatase A [Parabacteroides sp.]
MFKPLGCRAIERKCPGGYGVMFDDVLAGTYALIILLIIRSIVL